MDASNQEDMENEGIEQISEKRCVYKIFTIHLFQKTFSISSFSNLFSSQNISSNQESTTENSKRRSRYRPRLRRRKLGKILG